MIINRQYNITNLSQDEINAGWNKFQSHIKSIDGPLKELIYGYDKFDIFVDNVLVETLDRNSIYEKFFTNYRYSGIGKMWKIENGSYHLMYSSSQMVFSFDNHSNKCDKCSKLVLIKDINVFPCGATIDELFPLTFSVIKITPK